MGDLFRPQGPGVLRGRALIVSTALLLALAGCKDTDRPISYNKGVYGGPADQKLTAEETEALRLRGALQK